jgi:hypothetical protein
LLARAIDFAPARKRRESVFFIEHAQQLTDIGKYLPRPSDHTMAGYARNVSRKVGGRRFALIAEDIQADSSRIWLRLRQFVRSLSFKIDLPQEGTKATAFLGNYQCTPSGLHRGDSANFKFMVEGRNWDQLNHYARDRRPAMIGLQKNLFWRQMEKRASSTFDAAMKGREVEDALVARELNRLTSRGFGQVPPPLLRGRLADDASVRGDRDFPIRWHLGRHRNLICSANGHAFATLAAKAAVGVLERLNQGEPVRWADLSQKGMRRSDLRVLLEKLIALRAVSKL